MAQWAKAMKGDPKAFQIIQAIEQDPKRNGAFVFDPETMEYEVEVTVAFPEEEAAAAERNAEGIEPDSADADEI